LGNHTSLLAVLVQVVHLPVPQQSSYMFVDVSKMHHPIRLDW